MLLTDLTIDVLLRIASFLDIKALHILQRVNRLLYAVANDSTIYGMIWVKASSLHELEHLAAKHPAIANIQYSGQDQVELAVFLRLFPSIRGVFAASFKEWPEEEDMVWEDKATRGHDTAKGSVAASDGCAGGDKSSGGTSGELDGTVKLVREGRMAIRTPLEHLMWFRDVDSELLLTLPQTLVSLTLPHNYTVTEEFVAVVPNLTRIHRCPADVWVNFPGAFPKLRALALSTRVSGPEWTVLVESLPNLTSLQATYPIEYDDGMPVPTTLRYFMPRCENASLHSSVFGANPNLHTYHTMGGIAVTPGLLEQMAKCPNLTDLESFVFDYNAEAVLPDELVAALGATAQFRTLVGCSFAGQTPAFFDNLAPALHSLSFVSRGTAVDGVISAMGEHVSNIRRLRIYEALSPESYTILGGMANHLRWLDIQTLLTAEEGRVLAGAALSVSSFSVGRWSEGAAAVAQAACNCDKIYAYSLKSALDSTALLAAIFENRDVTSSPARVNIGCVSAAGVAVLLHFGQRGGQLASLRLGTFEPDLAHHPEYPHASAAVDAIAEVFGTSCHVTDDSAGRRLTR